MTQRIDALICPRWTIQVEPSCEVKTGLSLAVHEGRIVGLLPREAAESQYAPTAVFERSEHVLLPGLVNAHTHAAMTLLRGIADDLALERWLKEHIWPTEMRLVTPDFVADGTALAIAEMLRGGTTCFSDMYFFPDSVADTALSAGIRAVIGMIVLEFPSPWAEGPSEYFRKGLELFDRYKGHPLIALTFAPHAPYSVADDTLKRVRTLADELEVSVHMHVHETAAEVADAVAQSGQRPLARLTNLGLVTPGLIAVHATELDDEEIAQLAAAGAHVVHCPRSNLKLASGTCRVADLVTAGVNVALGTDGAASNNRLDLWSEMIFTALVGKNHAGDAEALPAEAVIRMATIQGARALGLGSEIGSLEIGKSADAICVRLDTPEVVPVLDPLSQLIYSAGREHVTDAWVAGEHVLADGTLTRLDEHEILERARDWGERILEP